METGGGNRGGGRRIQPSSPAALNLTPRQAEILAYVAEGKTNAEIGLILAISRRTVEKHVECILSRLGVGNRTAAAAIALYTVKSGG